VTALLPAPAPRTAPTQRAARLLRLPEVRWAVVATVLFALGGGAQLAGAPAPVWWTLLLACCAAGGWEPGLAGLRALRGRRRGTFVYYTVADDQLGRLLTQALEPDGS